VSKPPPRTFWARVKESLDEAGMTSTQAYVARKLNLTQPAITLWNKPGGYPTLENTISLAQHLNVNVEWLLTERGPKRPLPQDATAQKLWDMWPKLTDGDKRELLGVASGMLRRPDETDAPNERRRA
jgi:transcriptional regulator with XRE-family HTH domain